MKTSTEWDVLGGLRFALALIVFMSHLHGFATVPKGLHFFLPLNAFSAVLAFFLVSGYSIAHSLSRSTEGYYSRRADRILPVFLTALVLAAIPHLIWGQVVNWPQGGVTAPESIWTFLGNACLLQGSLVVALPTLAPAWTLGIEVQFYLVAPLLRRCPHWILLALILVSLAAFVRMGANGLSVMRFGQATVPLAWAWLAGFLFYYHRRSGLAKGILILLALITSSMPSVFGAGFSPVTLAGAAYVLTVAPEVRLPYPKVFSYLGDLSYPLYLVHYPVLILLTGGPTVRSYWVCIVAVLAASLATLEGVERPLRRRRNARRLGEQATEGVQR